MKLITPFIVIAVCVGLYFFYISPTLSEVKALSNEKKEYESLLLKLQDFKTFFDGTLTNYNSINQEDIVKLNKMIPEEFNPVDFVNTLDTMASRYGMKVSDYNVNQTKTAERGGDPALTGEGPYNKIKISFKVIGTYSQFVNFLSEIESSLNLMDVRYLQVGEAGGTLTGRLNFDVGLETYSLK